MKSVQSPSSSQSDIGRSRPAALPCEVRLSYWQPQNKAMPNTKVKKVRGSRLPSLWEIDKPFIKTSFNCEKISLLVDGQHGFSFILTQNGGTPARAALRWACGLGLGGMVGSALFSAFFTFLAIG